MKYFLDEPCRPERESMNEPTTRNITVLNRASVKRYALKISADRRAGKFSRVSEDFLERCEARLESAIRAIAVNGTTHETGPTYDGTFISCLARGKAEEMLETLAKRIVYSEVMKHPSLGCTLK